MTSRIPLLNACAAALAVVGCTQTDSRADSPKLRASDTAVAATVTTSPAQRAKVNYVGLRYEGLPRGFAYHAGSVITPPPPSGGDYAFSQVGTPKGEMIWLDSLGAAIRNGDRARTVRASLLIPPLAKDERLFMASCDLHGKLEPMIVAIVVNELNASRYTKIRQAWHADVATSRFEVIPLDGVVCEEPGS
jgi:hypothetical protein